MMNELSLSLVANGVLVCITAAAFMMLAKLRSKYQKARYDLQEAQLKLDAEQQLRQQQIDFSKKATEELQNKFEALSGKIFQTQNESFLKLANHQFNQWQKDAHRDYDLREKTFAGVVDPVQKALKQVDEKIHNLEKERVGAYADLRRHLTDLASVQKELRLETSSLVKALRSPTGRGQWGEMQLKRVVEMAGMLNYVDFVEQESRTDESGQTLRPDMLIKLPGNQLVVVDAKTPLMAYLEALDCQDDDMRRQKMAEHARHIRTHLKNLSQKGYWQQFENTPEFVVMFLPSESIFSTALEQDPSLIECGVRDKVILATPTTLIALLRAVSFGWRQEALQDNAKQISVLGAELGKRLQDMIIHFNKLGKNITQSVECYNQTLGSFESRVMVTAKKFQDLQDAKQTVELQEPIEKHTRLLKNVS